jgi:hypothetical protein
MITVLVSHTQGDQKKKNVTYRNRKKEKSPKKKTVYGRLHNSIVVGGYCKDAKIFRPWVSSLPQVNYR